MDNKSSVSVLNTRFLEELYDQYLQDPNSVDSSWNQYFSSIGNAPIKRDNTNIDNQATTNNTLGYELLSHYRQYGHQLADLDTLGKQSITVNNKIKIADKDYVVDLSDISIFNEISLGDLEVILQRTYSSTIGFEFEHIENIDERNWLYDKVEAKAWKISELFNHNDRGCFLQILLQTKMFENYLHTKFLGAKRFSVEGAESSILTLQEIIKLSASHSIEEVVIGMAHRGRLSTLAQVLHKPYSNIFAGFMGYAVSSELPSFIGDVKYHLGYANNVKVDDANVCISLAYNPSHLESVNSVVMGIVKAKQYLKNDPDKIIPILIHGDASFAGQGIVMESIAMSKLDAYDVGGVLHIIINNQIGFTTDPSQDRSTRYCSDVAKGFNIPVIHVNGNDPEAVVYAVRLAFEYKLYFKKDIVIDIVCHRKYGHNEGDEPMFTQPEMYSQIHSKEFKDCVDLYSAKVTKLDKGINVEKIAKDHICFMDQEFELAKKILNGESPYETHTPNDIYKKHIAIEKQIYKLNKDSDDIGFSKLADGDVITIQCINTGVSVEILKELGIKLTSTPLDFNINSKIARQFGLRRKMLESGQNIDWGTAEALAFGSLIAEGFNIRFTGQDVERGTFSHRHAVLTDQQNGKKYIPLNSLSDQQSGKITISNSSLSEFAVLGYEYGYSISSLNSLTIWEAQFGDFANGAQIIIDQYISAAESKWGILNNLVMLLPHGYEGQGPEHSSARLERFLQLCAQNNIQVCNCTTPASIFHVLRRQVLQGIKKPLIIMSPKSLLRHKSAVSKLTGMDLNTKFEPVITEDNLHEAKKIIFCSGKVYYDLIEHRESTKAQKVSIVRLEQLYPFPISKISQILSKSGNAEFIWCQEEPSNMGAYSFVKPIFERLGINMQYAGRKSAASPATGFTNLHQSELHNFLQDAIK